MEERTFPFKKDYASWYIAVLFVWSDRVSTSVKASIQDWVLTVTVCNQIYLYTDFETFTGFKLSQAARLCPNMPNLGEIPNPRVGWIYFLEVMNPGF